MLQVEELVAGISDNKPVVSSLYPTHLSCSWRKLGFFFPVKLQWLELDMWRNGSGSLVNKLEELSSLRVVGVELRTSTPSLDVIAVAKGGGWWLALWLHGDVLL